MPKVNNLLSTSRVAEVSTTSNEMTTLYGELDLSGDLYLHSLFAEYTPLAERISAAINRDQAESDLGEHDSVRDSEIRDIFYIVKGAAHNPIPVIKEAGQKVLMVIEKYGLAIVDESYAIESAHINSMTDDLSTVEMVEAISKIAGLELLISQLKQSQSEFEAARSAFDNANSTDKGAASASDIKKEILTLVNGKIVVYLRAMSMANPDMYGEFVRRTREIIERNNLQVKKRCN